MSSRPAQQPARHVRVIAAGGTIAMSGAGGATPELDADALIKSVPGLEAHEGLEAQTLVNLPSAHLSLSQQLEIGRAARRGAARNRRRRNARHRHLGGDGDALRHHQRR